MGDLSDTLQAAGSYLEAEKLGKEVGGCLLNCLAKGAWLFVKLFG